MSGNVSESSMVFGIGMRPRVSVGVVVALRYVRGWAMILSAGGSVGAGSDNSEVLVGGVGVEYE